MFSIAEGTDPIVLNLVGARMEVEVSATGLASGVVGGAITETERDDVLFPAIYMYIVSVVDDDCGAGTCTPDSPGETLVELFDSDGNNKVSYEEFTMSLLVSSLFASDVDLFDASGAFNPRTDGIKDSLSMGVGFSAVNATFVVP
jgi:hypothetical protein